jgi:hypothetical protein
MTTECKDLIGMSTYSTSLRVSECLFLDSVVVNLVIHWTCKWVMGSQLEVSILWFFTYCMV